MWPKSNTGQVIAALLVAAAFSIRQPASALRKLRAAVLVWISGLERDGLVGNDLARHRLGVCHECPLFVAHVGWLALGTCGSPLNKGLQQAGCACNMWAKSKFTDATCWLDDNRDDPTFGAFAGNGWIANLGSSSGDRPPAAAPAAAPPPCADV